MTDIVHQLRKPAPPFGFEEYDPTFDCRQDAASEIERLREENAAMREALTPHWGGLFEQHLQYAIGKLKRTGAP